MRPLRVSLRGDPRFLGSPGPARAPSPAGPVEEVDIRTLPFVRFDANEAHSQLYGMNQGEGVGGIGPDESHPFVIKDMKIRDSLWSFQPGAPSIVIDGMDISRSKYGIFLPRHDPRIQPYGRMTAKGVNPPGVLMASPTAVPGEQSTPACRSRRSTAIHGHHFRNPKSRWPGAGARDHGR